MPTTVQVRYCDRSSESARRLRDVVQSQFPSWSVDLVNMMSHRPRNNTDPVIRYGIDDGFDLGKKELLLFVENIIPNTMVSRSSLGDYETVVVKENGRTIVCLNKDAGTAQRYRFILNKIEWRINYSYGVVNNVLNKNLLPGEVFGKVGDESRWTSEQSSSIRRTLIDYTKRIGEKVCSRYPLVTHFGLDIIQDTSDGRFYLLELNRAHSLNEEGCYLLFKRFIEHHNRTSFGVVRTNLVNRINAANTQDELRQIIQEFSVS